MDRLVSKVTPRETNGKRLRKKIPGTTQAGGDEMTSLGRRPAHDVPPRPARGHKVDSGVPCLRRGYAPNGFHLEPEQLALAEETPGLLILQIPSATSSQMAHIGVLDTQLPAALESSPTLSGDPFKISRLIGHDVTRPRAIRQPSSASRQPPVYDYADDDSASSVYSQDSCPSWDARNTPRTPEIVDDGFESVMAMAEEAADEWDCGRKDGPDFHAMSFAWTLATPDQAKPASADCGTCDESFSLGDDDDYPVSPRSHRVHHFETLPARRGESLEEDRELDGAELYHATASHLAFLAREPPTSPGLNGCQPPPPIPERNPMRLVRPRHTLSFAAKVQETARQRPPSGVSIPGRADTPGRIDTTSGGISIPPSRVCSVVATAPIVGPSREPREEAGWSRRSSRLSQVLRRSVDHHYHKGFHVPRRRSDETESSSAEDSSIADLPPLTSTWSGSASDEEENSIFSPGHAALERWRRNRESLQSKVAQVRKSAGGLVMSREERRRMQLRDSIRVMTP